MAARRLPLGHDDSEPAVVQRELRLRRHPDGQYFHLRHFDLYYLLRHQDWMDGRRGLRLTTGLGSPNVANLAAQWKNVVFNSSTTTLGISQTNIAHGASVTLSGTVAGAAGTPTGDVAFIVSQGEIGGADQPDDQCLRGSRCFRDLEWWKL